MNQIVSCPTCGQKSSIPSKGAKNSVSCPACHTPLETTVPSVSPKKSAFEIVSWAVAVVVVLPGIYFFFWLLTSTTTTRNIDAQNEFGAQVQQTMAASPHEEGSASSVAQSPQDRPTAAPKPGSKGEDMRGEMFMGFMGYNKGMEWAANYGRVPTRSEYEGIVATVVAMGADDPNQALSKKFIEAFLEAFRSGCKAGLEQQRPAF